MSTRFPENKRLFFFATWQLAVYHLVDVGADLALTAPARLAEDLNPRHLPCEPHTTSAVDAPVHYRVHNRPEILVLHRPFVLVVPSRVVSVLHRDVLKVTLPALVADWTVQRVVRQKELHHTSKIYNFKPNLTNLEKIVSSLILFTSSCNPGFFRISQNPHSGHDLAGTGCDRLRTLFDLHQTHSAVARHHQSLMVTESRNHYSLFVTGLENCVRRVYLTQFQKFITGKILNQVKRRFYRNF